MPVHRFDPPAGRLVEIVVDSAAVAGNLLGDPARRRVVVYLPPGYDDGEDDYPLFIDLVGFTGSGLSHVAWRPFGESVPQRLDRLVAEQRMDPVVCAFPDCFTSLGGNQYVNSLATGRWADFLVSEMVPAIESGFRVRRGRQHRAVFGKSSGGYGALTHGLRFADAWGAVACHSGDMAFDLCYGPSLRLLPGRIAQRGGDVAGFLDELRRRPKATGEDMEILEMLAMAATYDPDPDAPMGVRLPLDLATGQMDSEAWQRWLAHDPVRLARDPAHQAQLRQLRGLFVDCGTRDQHQLVYGARQLHATLEEAGVPHSYEEFDDDHTNIDYRMDVSLPWLSARVGEPSG